MPPRTRHYDPIIQTEPPPEDELPPIHGFVVELPGAYIAAADVSAVLGRYAVRWHGEAREALFEMARYFASVEGTEAADGQEEPPEAIPEPGGIVELPEHAAMVYEPEASRAARAEANGDVHPDVALVEVYPDIDSAGTVTYWNARPVNADGVVVPGGFGNVNHEDLVRAVNAVMPGTQIQVGPDAMFDAFWEREQAAYGFNGRRRPSPRRLFS